MNLLKYQWFVLSILLSRENPPLHMSHYNSLPNHSLKLNFMYDVQMLELLVESSSKILKLKSSWDGCLCINLCKANMLQLFLLASWMNIKAYHVRRLFFFLTPNALLITPCNEKCHFLNKSFLHLPTWLLHSKSRICYFVSRNGFRKPHCMRYKALT